MTIGLRWMLGCRVFRPDEISVKYPDTIVFTPIAQKFLL
jgi:hypothetical protein